MRAEELVRRARVEVGAEGPHVDGGVRGQVDAVDRQPRAGVVDERGDLGDRRAGADQVGRPRDGHQPGPLGEHLGDVSGGELAGGRVERRPPHRRAGGLRGEDPRTDVGVVVEPGDHHLVAGAPPVREGARQVEGERGGAAPEDDAARVGAEQVGERGAGALDDVLGPPFGRGGRTAVRDRGGQRLDDRAPDGLGHLRAARAVEVRRPRAQRREVRADRGDVVAHVFPSRRSRSSLPTASTSIRNPSCPYGEEITRRGTPRPSATCCWRASG